MFDEVLRDGEFLATFCQVSLRKHPSEPMLRCNDESSPADERITAGGGSRAGDVSEGAKEYSSSRGFVVALDIV